MRILITGICGFVGASWRSACSVVFQAWSWLDR
jgi:hypothetical protein